MTTALSIPQGDLVGLRTFERPSNNRPRQWTCHMSVYVTHSLPLLAAGLFATLQQVPGLDVTLENWESRSLSSGAVQVLITDRREAIQWLSSDPTKMVGGWGARPKVIFLAAKSPMSEWQDPLAARIDAWLPIDCPADRLLAVVRQLGRSVLGPFAPQILPPVVSNDQPRRGGLAPGVLRKVLSHIEEHLAEGSDLESLARLAGVSRCHFSRTFKRSMGMSAHHYLIARRISIAISLIRETGHALSEIAVEVGFADQSHFSRTFLRLTGLTPGEFRHRGD